MGTFKFPEALGNIGNSVPFAAYPPMPPPMPFNQMVTEPLHLPIPCWLVSEAEIQRMEVQRPTGDPDPKVQAKLEIKMEFK